MIIERVNINEIANRFSELQAVAIFKSFPAKLSIDDQFYINNVEMVSFSGDKQRSECSSTPCLRWTNKLEERKINNK